MTSRSLQRRQLSRSKIDLFVECPRCLYLDVARGIPRPSGPPFTLNNAVDSLMKAEFDRYRASGEPHPLFATVGLDAVPFPHPDLDRWRHNFTGVRWLDEETGWTLFGAVDDLWKARTGELIVADYKATARAEMPTAKNLYPSYRRQMDVYQFLVRRQGLTVSNRCWFVYVNGDGRAAQFGEKLCFKSALVPYDGDDAWVLETFRRAIVMIGQASPPSPVESCGYCAYVAGASAAVVLALALSERVLGSARRTLMALTDGIRSFRDGDFSLRLAVTRHDELGDLVGLYNEMGDALRDERHDIYQRELLLDTVLQGAPMGIVLAGPTGRVAYANRAARQLLAGGRRMEGQAFESVVADCPAEIRDTLVQPGDALFTVPVEGEEETYRVARRAFQLNMQPHILYVVERLTPELRRQEVEVWKKAIRIMNHELNNSLAPIRSLVHSARHVVGHPEHEHRLEGIFDTLEERATYLSDFLEGYARFARLPRPQKREVAWEGFLEGVARMTPFAREGRPPAEPGHFDPAQVQQVLLNLLKNAYEAGSPADEVAVSVHRAVDGTAVVRVLDRGRGMDEEVMKRALLPFYSSKPAGTGLGLPLCQEIVEGHGGRLRVQARPGGGLVVTCPLPP